MPRSREPGPVPFGNAALSAVAKTLSLTDEQGGLLWQTP